MLSRREMLSALAASPLAAPKLARAEGGSTLRFVPKFDPGVLDPHSSTSGITRNHAFLVYETLYGMDANQQPQPQMVAGHLVEDDGLKWTLTLRPGQRFHDGEKVLARDCVASLKRWAIRDVFGQELMATTDELSAPDDRTLVFRLKRPFPLLPMAIGKAQGAAPMIMPARLAETPATKQVSEIIGSGPFRWNASEYVPGAFAAYTRFAEYQPREEGEPSGTAGPKHAYFDRVEWRVIPDVGTSVEALRSGEVDWLDFILPDLAGSASRDPGVIVRVLEPNGYMGVLRLNHLQPPFNNPSIRRTMLHVVDQTEVMQGMVGDNPAFYRAPVGVFCPGSAMDNNAGMAEFATKRDLAAMRAELVAAGYSGERVVMLMVTDLPQYRGACEVLAEQMKRVGFNVDYQAMDYNTMAQRRESREPVEKGGWSGFITNGWYGTDMLTPVTHTALRGNGAKGFAGWPDSPKLESLRRAWMQTADVGEQKRIAVELQMQAWIDVPYVPLGQNLQPVAYRNTLTGLLAGFPLFWNVRRT
jgi:peptide/nickel transport system substrate-binding protein